MKPAPFRHYAPTTVDEAVALLARLAPDDGRVLAGGQSLVPTMAFRLARPAHLIDINGIAALDRLAVEGDKLSIGACVRHAAFHRPAADGPLGKLLATVVRHIAHYPIRTRGTFCGSIANADPAVRMVHRRGGARRRDGGAQRARHARHRGRAILCRHHDAPRWTRTSC